MEIDNSILVAKAAADTQASLTRQLFSDMSQTTKTQKPNLDSLQSVLQNDADSRVAAANREIESIINTVV